jgi:hypothetical protein
MKLIHFNKVLVHSYLVTILQQCVCVECDSRSSRSTEEVKQSNDMDNDTSDVEEATKMLLLRCLQNPVHYVGRRFAIGII